MIIKHQAHWVLENISWCTLNTGLLFKTFDQLFGHFQQHLALCQVFYGFKKCSAFNLCIFFLSKTYKIEVLKILLRYNLYKKYIFLLSLDVCICPCYHHHKTYPSLPYFVGFFFFVLHVCVKNI